MPGKTTARTGVVRTIYLTPLVAALLADLAAKHPAGPLLRSSNGNGWNYNSVNCAVRRIRKKLGLGSEFTPRGLRRLFVTDALELLPAHVVAALVGHTSPNMILKRYSHLEKRAEVMGDAVRAVRGSSIAPATGSAKDRTSGE